MAPKYYSRLVYVQPFHPDSAPATISPPNPMMILLSWSMQPGPNGAGSEAAVSVWETAGAAVVEEVANEVVEAVVLVVVVVAVVEVVDEEL